MSAESRSYWHGSKIRFRRRVDGVRGEPVMISTTDHADVRGIYWTPDDNPRPRGGRGGVAPTIRLQLPSRVSRPAGHRLIDETELEWARWFDLAEVRDLIDDRIDGLSAPQPIAHYFFAHWLQAPPADATPARG